MRFRQATVHPILNTDNTDWMDGHRSFKTHFIQCRLFLLQDFLFCKPDPEGRDSRRTKKTNHQQINVGEDANVSGSIHKNLILKVQSV